MPIQTPPKPKTSKMAPAFVVGTLLLIGIVIASNWRALILVLIVLAAAGGYMLAK